MKPFWKVRLKHDKGYVTLRVQALSAEEASTLACGYEHAPLRAVVSVKSVAPTPAELRYECEQRSSRHFVRENMRFSGDTMRNYGVRANPVIVYRHCGESIECWELYRRRPVKHGLASSAFFSVGTFEAIYGTTTKETE